MIDRNHGELFIGIMSGTSCDAVDAALVNFEPHKKPVLLATHSEPLSNHLQDAILSLTTPNTNEINRLGKLDVELGELFALTVLHLLQKTSFTTHDIVAIGSAGQTIRHSPESESRFTLQIGDPNIIVSQTNIMTITDFRRRDVANGGQGAPLAPAFHEYLLRNTDNNRWVLNIGGIANLTWLPKDPNELVIGFDTGPGNCLMNSWCLQHTGAVYDNNGELAASGNSSTELLNAFLQNEPYFAKTPPKSTGRELFHLAWLNQFLQGRFRNLPVADVQATLLELTAQSIIGAIQRSDLVGTELWVCGGGSQNKALMRRLEQLCLPMTVQPTDNAGIPTQWIEAAAFAWLARQNYHGLAGNIPSVTGAKHANILGAIYKI